MAITINNNADTPNLANNRLVYSVESTNASEPQFRFVLDINDKDGTLLQRVKNQPTPDAATAIFDIGQIITNYVGPTDTIFDTTTDNTPNINTNCAKDFQIRIGEEYGTSSTSSVDLYPGNYTGGGSPAPGDPAVSSSNYNYFIDGVKDINTVAGGFDWDSSEKYDEEDTYGEPIFTHQNGLTDFTTNEVRLGDYHTVSILNGNTKGTASADLDNGFAQDVYAMVVKEYSSTDTILATNTYYNLSLRSTIGTLWDDVYLNQTERTRLIHWGVGPQNINNGANALNANTSYYIVTFHSQTPEPGVNDDGVWSTHRFNIVNEDCAFDGTRFAYKNQYGVWDYFNFNLATTTTSNIQRDSFEQNFVDYSSTVAALYQPSRRGKEQFNNSITKNRTAESDYLTQTEADNLRELFYSANVYVQNPNGTVLAGDNFLPVVITNASITEKTNNRSQKLFRYTVEFQYANEIQARG